MNCNFEQGIFIDIKEELLLLGVDFQLEEMNKKVLDIYLESRIMINTFSNMKRKWGTECWMQLKKSNVSLK